MSENLSELITTLARLEEAERENQKLRSERLLAEHARDEAQREVGRVRDMLAIAERDLAAPINEDALRRRNGGALPVGNGCEIAVRGTTARAEAAEARARDTALDRDMNDDEAGYFRRTCLALEARLRAVIKAGDGLRRLLAQYGSVTNPPDVTAAIARWNTARTAGLQPAADTGAGKEAGK